ncbi:MAG TPA: D-alanine--D-alanine ligase, partial [Vicinamibacteria bacterium]
MRIAFTFNVKPRAPASDAGDRYAEWDEEETIAAVEAALSRAGEVIRVEATGDLPVRLHDVRPDIVFNIAEGLRGPNREAHVPAICEFWSTPYTGSDSLTMSLCLDKGRTKEVLAHHGIATAPFAV